MPAPEKDPGIVFYIIPSKWSIPPHVDNKKEGRYGSMSRICLPYVDS